MLHSLLDLVYQAVNSPWIYLALALLAGLDGFFPVVPGETALVAVAVFAASGESNLLATIAAGAAGVFLGDHVSYLLGRVTIGGLRERVRTGTRSGTAFEWAERRLAERGGSVLIASRFIPGVRTATTMTMGAIRYRLPRFSAFDSIASICWASGWSLIGFIGGAAFKDAPLKGLLLGLGIALALTILAELLRRGWQRSTRGSGPAPDRTDPPDEPTTEAD